MKHSVLVHFQFMPDKGELLEKKLLKYPFSASIVANLFDPNMTFESGHKICPDLHPENNFYPEYAKKIFNEKFSELEIPVFAEGYRHCHEPCFIEGKEPYHEFVCADGTARSLKEQIKIMQTGIDVLVKNLGKQIKIVGEVPPNHQGNWDTKKAARQLNLEYYVVRRGFDYPESKLKSPCLFNLPAWEENGLIILPESKRPEKSPLFYVMYDNIVEKGWEKFEPLFENSIPLSEIEIKKKPQNLAKWSEWFLYKAKNARDLRKKIKSNPQQNNPNN